MQDWQVVRRYMMQPPEQDSSLNSKCHNLISTAPTGAAERSHGDGELPALSIIWLARSVCTT
jgi:hypothetical protein